MLWIGPITDRTLADVQYAKQQSKNNTVPPENLKGCLNISDLNRLSSNLNWIKQNIAIYKYPQSVIPPEWKRTDFFFWRDLNSYEENIYYLEDLYSLKDMYPSVDFGEKEVFGENGRRTLDYVKLNQWETIMFYLYKFAVESLVTWQDIYDNFDTWQEVFDFYENWGDVLKWNKA